MFLVHKSSQSPYTFLNVLAGVAINKPVPLIAGRTTHATVMQTNDEEVQVRSFGSSGFWDGLHSVNWTE